jgi:hypothetical protein
MAVQVSYMKHVLKGNQFLFASWNFSALFVVSAAIALTVSFTGLFFLLRPLLQIVTVFNFVHFGR